MVIGCCNIQFAFLSPSKPIPQVLLFIPTPMLDDVNSTFFHFFRTCLVTTLLFIVCCSSYSSYFSKIFNCCVCCKMCTIIYVHCPLFIIGTLLSIEPNISFDIHQPANTILWQINLSIHRPNDHRLVFYVRATSTMLVTCIAVGIVHLIFSFGQCFISMRCVGEYPLTWLSYSQFQ